MNKVRALQFALARGNGDIAIKKALRFLWQNQMTWDEFLSDDFLLLSAGITKVSSNEIMQLEHQAMDLYQQLQYNGIDILIEDDDNYPQQLKHSLKETCPPILFVRGNASLLNSLSVGFCGSRKVSEKGVILAERCVLQLTQNNITVTSGYAAGTDIVTHRTALENNGNTIFVLAEGILKTRIKHEIKELINDNNHVFVSQFMPNVTWNAGNAMKRNGVIIGLSKAMILVESSMSGGTFAAGEEALRVRCPLFVIDYKDPQVSAEANPYFISKGGIPIRGKNLIPNISKVIETVKNESSSDDTSPLSCTEQLRLDI